jgi:thiamine biosynthesis protein ThiS
LKIRLNGDPHELAEPLTVLQLLEQLAIDPRIVAVEHNLTIIKRDRYGSTVIGEGDEVEIVRFVGGGSTDECVNLQLPTSNSQSEPRSPHRLLLGVGSC